MESAQLTPTAEPCGELQALSQAGKDTSTREMMFLQEIRLSFLNLRSSPEITRESWIWLTLSQMCPHLLKPRMARARLLDYDGALL